MKKRGAENCLVSAVDDRHKYRYPNPHLSGLDDGCGRKSERRYEVAQGVGGVKEK
jgi:hypothetical protein